MCGILGLITQAPFNEHRFKTALSRLSHRGPETSKIENLDRVVLGFARLSIQDLSSAGDQPMSDTLRENWIVFNGEIYNFNRLRKELESEGCEFRSTSDTEVILQGFRVWGWPRLLDRLEGMFALGIYDRINQKVYLARDRIGIKPLFFHSQGNELIFASEIKAITAYIGPKPLNRGTSLNAILTTGLCPPGTTVFQDIQELEPGCYLEYDLRSSRQHIQRYFDITSLVSKDDYLELAKLPAKELVSRHCETFNQSIASHLISDAKLGVMFSAGLDSSLVAAVATQSGRPDVKLYYFHSETFDTTKYSVSFQKQFSSDLNTLRFNEHDVIFDLPKMIYNYETINKEEGTVLSKVCKAASEDGCKVLLTGDGCDELYGGYSTHWSFYTRSVLHNNTPLRTMVRLLRKVLPGLERAGDLPRETDYFLTPSTLNLMEVPANLLFHGGTRLEGWKRSLGAYDFLSDPSERDTAACLLDDMTYHMQRYLIRADRMGMQESVELRVPYVHPPVMRMAVNTPVKWRVGRSIFSRRPDFWTLYNGKKIVREMAKVNHVPKDIIYRKKIGTSFDGRQQVISLIENFSLENVSQFFDLSPKVLRTILLESFDRNSDRIQWSILATEILMREFVQEQHHEDISEEFRSILHHR